MAHQTHSPLELNGGDERAALIVFPGTFKLERYKNDTILRFTVTRTLVNLHLNSPSAPVAVAIIRDEYPGDSLKNLDKLMILY